MNDLHFYFTTARARYCFYYFIVNANKKKKKEQTNETLTNLGEEAKFVKQESFVRRGRRRRRCVSFVLLC